MTKLEINRIPATSHAASAFVAELDRQIDELDTALTVTKQLRGAIARAFGIDRRDGGTPMQRILDGANRSVHEIEAESQAALERELEFKGDAS